MFTLQTLLVSVCILLTDSWSSRVQSPLSPRRFSPIPKVEHRCPNHQLCIPPSTLLVPGTLAGLGGGTLCLRGPPLFFMSPGLLPLSPTPVRPSCSNLPLVCEHPGDVPLFDANTLPLPSQPPLSASSLSHVTSRHMTHFPWCLLLPAPDYILTPRSRSSPHLAPWTLPALRPPCSPPVPHLPALLLCRLPGLLPLPLFCPLLLQLPGLLSLAFHSCQVASAPQSTTTSLLVSCLYFVIIVFFLL